jgi:hypothetical protein
VRGLLLFRSFPDDPRSGLVNIFPARGLFLGGFFRFFGFLGHGSILQGDSVSRVARLLDAVDSSPAFHGFVIAGFPIDQFGHNLEARHNFKAECSLILENDFNDVEIGRHGKFHFRNDLAFCLSEPLDALVRLVFGTLTVSH